MHPVRFESKDQSKFGGSLSADIGEGGIKLNVGEFLPLYTELNMQIYLDPQKVIECMGKVVWVKKVGHSERYEAGLEFTSSDQISDFKRQIHEFVESNT